MIIFREEMKLRPVVWGSLGEVPGLSRIKPTDSSTHGEGRAGRQYDDRVISRAIAVQMRKQLPPTVALEAEELRCGDVLRRSGGSRSGAERCEGRRQLG